MRASRAWRPRRVRESSAARASAHALAADGTRARAGHTASGQVAGGEVTMELMTPALRGLSENDFIVAAKADALSLADLVVAKKKATFYF